MLTNKTYIASERHYQISLEKNPTWFVTLYQPLLYDTQKHLLNGSRTSKPNGKQMKNTLNKQLVLIQSNALDKIYQPRPTR